MRANEKTVDKRPDPKPRKRAYLWQSFLFWDELVRMQMRHNLRVSSIERGKSNLDAVMEKQFMEDLVLDRNIQHAKKTMIEFGQASAPEVWQWMTSIKGMGAGGNAAKIIALIDDIGKFSTVSKLWRFCGLAVIDGRAEYGTSSFCRKLKATLIGEMGVAYEFVIQQTPLYVDIYYQEKERLKCLYPEPVYAPPGYPWPMLYTPMHIDRMAKRKVAKIFIQHLWLIWRQAEGLPVSDPYAIAILNHADYILPAGAS